jgi:cytochrome c-type biogenesis protein CcmH
MVEGLSALLQDNPNDGQGWAMLGRSLRVLGQPDRAKSAFERALPLLPDNAQVRLEYASLLIEDLPAGSALPPKFVEIMKSVLAIDPNVPDALYFVGLSEAQAGRPEKAKELWTTLLNHLPPDSPDIAEIKRQIKALKLPE